MYCFVIIFRFSTNNYADAKLQSHFQNNNIDANISLLMSSYVSRIYSTIAMRVNRNIRRDFNSKNKFLTKFSHLNALNDGPLVAAVSIRTLEKLTDVNIYNKEFDIRTTNISAFVNLNCSRGSCDNKILKLI